MCQMMGSFLTNYILKTVLANVEQYSTWRLACPINAGSYTVTNFGGIESFIPDLLKPFLIPAKFQIEIIIDANVEGWNGTQNIGYIKSLGSFTGGFGKK